MVIMVFRNEVVMSKREFIKIFRHYLLSEQVWELLGGYYDGDTMKIHSLRVEVLVSPHSVVVPRKVYENVVGVTRSE